MSHLSGFEFSKLVLRTLWAKEHHMVILSEVEGKQPRKGYLHTTDVYSNCGDTIYCGIAIGNLKFACSNFNIT